MYNFAQIQEWTQRGRHGLPIPALPKRDQYTAEACRFWYFCKEDPDFQHVGLSDFWKTLLKSTTEDELRSRVSVLARYVGHRAAGNAGNFIINPGGVRITHGWLKLWLNSLQFNCRLAIVRLLTEIIGDDNAKKELLRLLQEDNDRNSVLFFPLLVKFAKIVKVGRACSHFTGAE